MHVCSYLVDFLRYSKYCYHTFHACLRQNFASLFQLIITSFSKLIRQVSVSLSALRLQNEAANVEDEIEKIKHAMNQ